MKTRFAAWPFPPPPATTWTLSTVAGTAGQFNIRKRPLGGPTISSGLVAADPELHSFSFQILKLCGQSQCGGLPKNVGTICCFNFSVKAMCKHTSTFSLPYAIFPQANEN
ncbi:hypothetical protein EV424DRAFT_1348087 [Suillus variegatus]|nr:hypothetical protein EV424DRAFT_1348087 [Suillus variegatus]